jgi:hypothetical protein
MPKVELGGLPVINAAESEEITVAVSAWMTLAFTSAEF